MVVNNDKIKNFWNWFEQNSQQINPEIITQNMISSLDSKILELGDFAWEIREGKTKPYMLVISPGGDAHLLGKTKTVIESSISISDWEFEYYKPAKDWDYTFFINETTEINASNWEYVLLKFSDGTFDILIKVDNLNKLDGDDQDIAINIVLESTIGEKIYIERIVNYEIVTDFENKYDGKQNKITVLSDHLTQMLE